MSDKYTWAEAYPYRVPAHVDGKVIKRLSRGGELQPARLVEEARGETSPLHPVFEWDDSEAGRQYRLQQAREMLRHIRIVRAPDTEPRRMFYHLKRGDPYMTAERVVTDAEMLAQLERRAILEIMSARQRYAEVKALAKVWEAVDQLELVIA